MINYRLLLKELRGYVLEYFNKFTMFGQLLNHPDAFRLCGPEKSTYTLNCVFCSSKSARSG